MDSSDKLSGSKTLQVCNALANMHFAIVWRELKFSEEKLASLSEISLTKEFFKEFYWLAFQKGWVEGNRTISLSSEQETAKIKQNLAAIRKRELTYYDKIISDHKTKQKFAQQENTVESWKKYATSLEDLVSLLIKVLKVPLKRSSS